jgi:cytochrome c553
MKKIIQLISMTLLAMTAGQPAFAGDAERGKAIATTCLACHGETGNSMAGAFPNIAGQTEQYLLKQLIDVRDGMREIPTMIGQLDNFSDEDLADIAAYYASQERSYGAAKADLVEMGETIYRFGVARKNVAACTACHAPNGMGNGPAGFPALAGQWPEYTVSQLKAFQSGARHNDGDGKMMRSTALDMNEQEMNAVASYISGLK